MFTRYKEQIHDPISVSFWLSKCSCWLLICLPVDIYNVQIKKRTMMSMAKNNKNINYRDSIWLISVVVVVKKRNIFYRFIADQSRFVYIDETIFKRVIDLANIILYWVMDSQRAEIDIYIHQMKKRKLRMNQGDALVKMIHLPLQFYTR